MGGKSQGIASLTQFEEIPNIGDELEFHIERYDPREGLLILNRKGSVSGSVTWDTLEIGQIVEGTVTGMNKGGLEVQVKGMRAFMPSGQVDIVFHKDISVFINQRVTAEVMQFDREKKNLIISRRNIIEREREEARAKMLTELAEGQVRRGTVRNVMEYGAFVDIGGVDGLVHVSEISHRRVKNPAEVLKVGDMVDVKIVRIDKETGKIGLSLKQAMADPWQNVTDRYAVGASVTARGPHRRLRRIPRSRGGHRRTAARERDFVAAHSPPGRRASRRRDGGRGGAAARPGGQAHDLQPQAGGWRSVGQGGREIRD